MTVAENHCILPKYFFWNLQKFCRIDLAYENNKPRGASSKQWGTKGASTFVNLTEIRKMVLFALKILLRFQRCVDTNEVLLHIRILVPSTYNDILAYNNIL